MPNPIARNRVTWKCALFGRPGRISTVAFPAIRPFSPMAWAASWSWMGDWPGRSQAWSQIRIKRKRHVSLAQRRSEPTDPETCN